MCKFSTSLAPPPAPEGLEQLLDEELNEATDFNWFDAIDAIDGAELGLDVPAQQAASSSASEHPDGGMVVVPRNSPVQTSGSDGSSYDLVEMFKQQVEQDAQQASVTALASTTTAAAAAAAPPQPVFAAAPFMAPFMAPAAVLVQQQQQQQQQQQALMCGVGPAFGAACLPQMLGGGAPLTPSSAFLAPPAAVLALPGAAAALQFEAAGTAAAASAPSGTATTTTQGGCGSEAGGVSGCRRSRASKTQEELDAAVERIKQKRRESAQRSRARKNDYMRTLELENQALKDEVARLHQVMAALQQRAAAFQHPAAALVPLGAM